MSKHPHGTEVRGMCCALEMSTYIIVISKIVLGLDHFRTEFPSFELSNGQLVVSSFSFTSKEKRYYRHG